MKKRNVKNFIAIFSAMMMCIVFFTAGIFFVSNSKAGSITVDESNGVSIYVNGEYVVENADGSYSVTKDSTITIVAVNEYKILSKLIVTKDTNEVEVNSNYYTMNLTTDSQVSIKTESVAASVDDKGNLFANPYLITDGLDLYGLSEIYAFKDGSPATDSLKGNLQRFFDEITDETTLSSADVTNYRNRLYGKYFRVTDDIMMDRTEFYGIGNAINPFVGNFDFLNNSVIVNVSNVNYSHMFNNNEFDIGLFGYISSNADSSSVIRNANIRGSVSLSGNNGEKNATINAGGVAGKVSGNVVLRNISCGASISITDDCSVNIGGTFGLLSTPIENNANISYVGSNTSLNVNTNDTGAYINAGFLCGLLDNVYCNSFNCSTTSTMVIANATNEITGNCNAAGVIGKVLNTTEGKYTELIISNVDVSIVGEYVVSATINNSGNAASENTYASAAGVYGNVECATSKTVKISRVYTGRLDSLDRDRGLISITASNTSRGSVGNVYAGGLYGYVDNESVKGVYLDNRLKPREYICFKGDTDISAIQQGTSQAYAGGIFAYNAYHFPTNTLSSDGYTKMYLNSEKDRLDIQAIQSTTSTTKDEKIYQEATCAGFYSSKLPTNCSINNYELNVYNGHVAAIREVGSTASGSVHAGGFAGFAEADNSEANRFTNVTLNLKDCSIEALNLSYDSKSAHSSISTNNAYNIAAGGFIGHLKNYGTDNVNFSNNTSSNNPGLDNVKIDFSFKEFKTEHPVIRCVQNADMSNGAHDNVSEGYAGGLVGYLEHSFIRNSSVVYTGTDSGLVGRAVITTSGSNKPNTTAIGGLVGESYLGANAGIEGCYVENMRIYGTAYYYSENDINDGDMYDIYVGGIIGVAGYASASNNVLIKNCYINNSRVEAFGERLMLPYAGGIAGGMWWGGSQSGKIYNCAVIDSMVYAKSIRNNSYAGGVCGLLQNGAIDSCNVIKTYVRASTYNDTKTAFSAGITSRLRNNNGVIKNCISNANVTGEGKNVIKSGISITGDKDSLLKECSNNYFAPLKIGHENGELISDLRGALNYDGTKTDNNSKCSPIILGRTGDGKFYDYVTLGTNTTTSFEPFRYINTYNDVTDIVTIRMDLSNYEYGTLEGKTFKLKSDLPSTTGGSVFVNLYIKVNFIEGGEEYLLCSLPVYVNSDTSEPMYVVKDFDTKTALDPNSSSYYYRVNSEKKYEYVMINNDTDDLLQTIQIDFEDDRLTRYQFYSIKDLDNLNPVINEENLLQYKFNDSSFGWIINKIATNDTGVNIDVDDDILYFDDNNYIKITAVDFLNNRVIGVFKFDYDVGGVTNSKYVIVDFVPNYITDIDIVVSSDTTDLGHTTIDGVEHHIFAPGDTAVLSVIETHRDGKKFSFNKSSRFEQKSYDNGNIGITTNGHMSINENTTDGATAKIIATYVGSCNTHVIANKEFNIMVKKSVTLSSNVMGGIFDSTRKVARDTPFTFVLTPNHGFGYNPNSLIIKINGTDIYNLTDSSQGNNKIKILDSVTVNQNFNGEIKLNNHVFTYVYNATDGSYTVTIPSTLLGTSTNSISVEAEFPVIYKLVFDRGSAYENYNERYFVYTVKENSTLSPELRDEIIGESIYVERFGFNLEGYYLTDIGSKIESYGQTFSELCDSNESVIGTLSFYARWTYDVAIEKPDGINVKSSMPLGSLEEDASGNLQLIPINTQKDFTFYFDKNSDFAGSPEFRVYIVTYDGSVYSYNDVTSQCVYNAEEDSYSLSNSIINGLIFIKINTTAASFNQGVSNQTVSLDKKVYSDNTFTLSYSINYSKGGIDKEKAALTKGINFTFSKNLPLGTTLELYRQVNNTPLDVGRLVLSSARNQVSISEFIDINIPGNVPIGSSLNDPKFDKIDSELYYIVVTPPAYNNEIIGDCSVTVTSVYDDPTAVNSVYYGNDSKTFIEQNSRPTYDFGIINYQVYNGKTLSVAKNGNGLQLTVNDSANLSDVVENRHKGTYLLWCVEAPNGELYNLTDSTTNAAAICTTDTAHYFLASSGNSFNIAFVTAGYTIKLIETKDIINPAVKPVIIKEIII